MIQRGSSLPDGVLTQSALPWQVPGAWRWRFALGHLALKELQVRYKSPALGIAWALAVPLAASAVLAFVFSRLIRVPVAGVPFFLFLIAGAFPWNFFQLTVSSCTTSLQDNGALIRRTNFPRALIPLSILLANLVNFLIALGVVAVFVRLCGFPIGVQSGLLACALLLHVSLTAGIALLVAAWQAEYRDLKYLVEVALLMWFYLTPIIYPASTIASLGGLAHLALLANPMAGIVSLYRAGLFGWSAANLPESVAPSAMLLWTLIAAMGCLAAGWRVFDRRAATVADYVQ